MSDGKDTSGMNYAPHRISKKQEKLWRATTLIQRLKEHTRKDPVIGVPILVTMRNVKEIVSGLALPKKERI